jgi:hypothetical protein
MAPTKTTELTPTERDVLGHFGDGVGVRTIGLRTGLEHTEVQEIVNTTCGGDRGKAAALVADYDKRHPDGEQPAEAAAAKTGMPEVAAAAAAAGLPARREPTRRPAGRAPAKRARAAVQPAEDDPQAPTVVPVKLDEINAPTEAPAALADDPAPAEAEDAPAGGRAEDLPLEPAAPADDDTPPPATPAEAEADPVPTDPTSLSLVYPITRCTHGGDCPVHPNVSGIHNFDAIDTDALLDGPTEALPQIASFEELMAAAQRAGDPVLAALARQVSEAVDALTGAYDRERKVRAVRAEAHIIRRELATRLGQLRRLTAGGTDTSPDATAAA